MLNKIITLDRSNQLIQEIPPYARQNDVDFVMYTYPQVLNGLKSPETFVFTWMNSGARITLFDEPRFPGLTREELIEAADYPVPHEKVIVQTEVPYPGGGHGPTCLWLVQRTAHGYNAIPLAFANDTLTYSGLFLIFDRRHRHADGTPVLDFKAPVSLRALHSPSELIAHHHMLLRFFRTLCQPAVEIENVEPDERLNRARVRRGHTPMPMQHVVRLPAVIIHRGPLADARAREFGPRATHNRRSHRRTLASGRSINVRSCVINAGIGAPPVPQAFHIEEPEE